MELTITKDFLDNFFLSQNDTNEVYADFEKFLTKQVTNFSLITDFQDINELQQASTENPIWEIMLDRGINLIDYKPNLEQEMIIDTFYEDGSPFKLFCTNYNNNECDDLSEKFGYEFFNHLNINTKWNKYNSNRDDYFQAIDNYSNPRFDTWQKLNGFDHPVNSIVIFDKYLFTEMKNATVQQFCISKNLLEILSRLLKNVDNKKKLIINVLIDKRNIKLNDPSMPSNVNQRMLYIKNIINNHISSSFPLLDFEITIVHYTYVSMKFCLKIEIRSNSR